MTHDNAEDVEARVLWQAGMNAVAAHGSPSSWPLKKRVRRKVADAHKYGMLRFVVPLLHVHLLLYRRKPDGNAREVRRFRGRHQAFSHLRVLEWVWRSYRSPRIRGRRLSR